MMSRICLVGAGELSRKHAEALEGLPGHQIAAIVDADTAAARKLARRSGAGKVFASVEEAFADASFDRAHVLVPPDQRPGAALPLLAAGKPVLLEQPVATDPEACNSMLEAAKNTAPPSASTTASCTTRRMSACSAWSRSRNSAGPS